MLSSHVQPVQGRTAGGGRPALVTGVLLLVASLALLVPPRPGPLDLRSISSSPQPPADVLVQGPGAAAVAAVGGRPLAALPIVDGLLARVPAHQGPRRRRRPGGRAVTDADRPLSVRAADPTPGGGDSPEQPASGSASVPLRGTSLPEVGVTPARVAVGVLDTGIAGGADLVDLKVAGADGSTTLGQVLAAMQLADAARERFNLRVLNVSLGAPADDPATAPLTEAVERLWADGITVVAAAGTRAAGSTPPG